MPNRTNRLMVKEFKSWLGEGGDMVFVGYKGLSSGDVFRLRSELALRGGRMRVVKNSIARLAFKETGNEGAGSLVDGPTAILRGSDVIAMAKAAAAFARKHRALELRGGLVGGARVSAAEVLELSRLPSREALIAKVAGLIIAPAGRLAGMLSAAGGALARAIKAMGEKAAASAPQGQEVPSGATGAEAAPPAPAATG
jgi:large subunit ribosomal protein L10